MKRTGPTGHAKSVHTRDVHMPLNTEEIPATLLATSINSADHSLMPTTAAPTSDFQRRPTRTHPPLPLSSLPRPLRYD